MDLQSDLAANGDATAVAVGDHLEPDAGTTISTYDSATGQTVVQHWDDDGSSVSLVYDAWGVVVGAEVVSAEGDVVQVTGDGVADVAADLAVTEDLPLSCPWGSDGMVCQLPIDEDLVTVDDVTSSEAYVEWLDEAVVGSPDVVGDVSDAGFWFEQSTDFTCGPAAATQIIEDFTGVELGDESVVASYAAEQGWLADEGMDPYHLADLLTDFGVPSTVHADQTWEDIAAYLEDGRSVVMTVDAYDYWEGAGADDEAEDSDTDGVNHAVRVVAIDIERGVAVLSDTGTPDGQQLEVPLEAMEEAWDDVTGYDEVGNPIRDHLLVVSETPDTTDAAPTDAGDVDTIGPDGAATTGGGTGTDAVAASAGADGAADLDTSSPSPVARLFSNPHGWVLVPVAVAVTRIVGAVRR
jgi:hypothetical protein